MWTEANVTTVLDKVRDEVDRIVGRDVSANVSDGGQSDNKARRASNVVERGDDNVRSFCHIDVVSNRLESQCFRLGSGDQRLHLWKKYASKDYGDGKPSVRAVKYGRFIKCYATCCNNDLGNGCHTCDRLPVDHHGTPEEHFIDTDARPPMEVGSVIELVKIVCMSWAGNKLYNEYKIAQMGNKGNKDCTTIPVSLHSQLVHNYAAGKVNDEYGKIQDNLSALNSFLKKRHEHNGRKRKREEAVSQPDAELRLEELHMIHQVQRACVTGTDLELCAVIEDGAKRGGMPTFYTHDADRKTINMHMNNFKQENFRSLVNLTQRKERGMAALDDDGNFNQHTENVEFGVGKLINQKEGVREAFAELCNALGMPGLRKRLKVECNDDDENGSMYNGQGAAAAAAPSAKLLLYSYDL